MCIKGIKIKNLNITVKTFDTNMGHARFAVLLLNVNCYLYVKINIRSWHSLTLRDELQKLFLFPPKVNLCCCGIGQFVESKVTFSIRQGGTHDDDVMVMSSIRKVIVQ